MDTELTKVVKILQSQEWILYILQVGSSLNTSHPKDIDILVGYMLSYEESAYEVLRRALANEDVQDVKLSDDALRFTINNATFDLALYRHEYVVNIVTGVVTGTQIEGRPASWATKLWLPEGFCADILAGKVLYDKKNFATPLIATLREYPEAFRQKVMERCRKEAVSKMSELLRLSEENFLEAFLLRSDIAAMLVRYAFASGKIYLPSFKKLVQRAKKLDPKNKQIFDLACSLEKSNNDSINEQIKNLILNEQ